MAEILSLDDFPSRTYDKLRYCDTDRQGHVNNAVFATLLETGRVEILYNPAEPLAEPGASWVIARLTLEFMNEISWPGRVDIGTRVKTIGRSSATLEQGLFQNGKLVGRAETIMVQMNDSTRRSQPLGQKAIARLSTLLVTTAASPDK
ncbi:MAG: acyl-CoA thioesterase [Sulfurifustaceae bacterium]